MKGQAFALSILAASVSINLFAQDSIPDFYNQRYIPTVGFFENQGQVIDTQGDKRPDVVHYSQGTLPTVYTRTESRVSFAIHIADTIYATVDTIYHLEMFPVGLNAATVDPVGSAPMGHQLNYFLPHCDNGITSVGGFSRVVYEGIYPSTDLHFYSGGFGQKMALVCWPGADPDDIALQFNGQDSLAYDLIGNLRFYHDGRYFTLPHAVAYQFDENEQIIPVFWDATFEANLNAGIVQFQWSDYDPDLPLVFLVGLPPLGGSEYNTPGVCWSSYLGGDGGDRIYASDTDDDGNYYVGGFTESQTIYFPIEDGVVYYEATPMAFVSKFNDAFKILWSTYYGGSEGDLQYVSGLKTGVGADPNIFIGGLTRAGDLWVVPDDDAYYQPDGVLQFISSNAFIAELDHEGVAVWSTYFGTGAIAITSLDLQPDAFLAVAGTILSENLPPPQETPANGAADWAYSGSGDVFVAVFNADRRTIWTTYVGGSANDGPVCVRLGSEKLVLAGTTASSDIQTLDGGSNAHDEGYGGGTNDLFIMEFKIEGVQTWGTYLGGAAGENVGRNGLAIEPAVLGSTEDIYITGVSASHDLPLEEGPNWYDHDPKNGLQGILARFSGLDRSLKWLTYAKGTPGTTGSSNPEVVIVDEQLRSFISGYTTDATFPIENAFDLYTTPIRYGSGDGFLMCFSEDQQLRWSTFFGGDEGSEMGERIETLAVHADQMLYAGGFTFTAFGPDVFFPFTDPPGDDDHFDNIFFPVYDGFIAGFCIDNLLTSAPGATIASTSGIGIASLNNDQYLLTGLPDGSHRIRLFDARGAQLWEQRLVSAGQRSAPFDVRVLVPGIYFCQIEDVGIVKLVRQP